MSQGSPRGARGSGNGPDPNQPQQEVRPTIRVTEGKGEGKDVLRSSTPAFLVDIAVYDEKTGTRLSRGTVRIKSNTAFDLYTEAKVLIDSNSMLSVIEVFDLSTFYIELHDVAADVEFLNTMTLEFVKRRLVFV